MGKKLFDIKALEALADDTDDSDDDDYLALTEDEIKEKFPSFPSIKLADMIIAQRYIGLYKNLSISAMEELSKRRVAGDNFQYESYIEDNLKTLPKLDFTLPQITSLLDKVKVFKK